MWWKCSSTENCRKQYVKVLDSRIGLAGAEAHNYHNMINTNKAFRCCGIINESEALLAEVDKNEDEEREVPDIPDINTLR